MPDYARLERQLVSALHIERRPIAIAFRDAPPPGVAKFTGTEPSGCSFWRIAADGAVFYTEPSDHYNCPVGSYTHGLPLPPEREQELGDMLTLMSDIGYIRMEEVPGIPRVPAPPAAIVYAPLGDTPVDPDVILLAGVPATMMLLHEAAIRAGTAVQPLLGRPTCMAIPATLSGGMATSLGCVGNRVYTGVADDAFYSVMSAKDAVAIVAQLETVKSANATLMDYHRARRAALSTADIARA
jgi:uncharacterized protein (DUF169 family)